MKTSLRTLCVLSLTLASICGETALAQNSDENRPKTKRREQTASQSTDRDTASDMKRKDSRSQASQRSQKSESRRSQDDRVEPEGWVTVATDYNDDGFYDSVETIYYYDLKQAQDRSKQRSDRDRNAKSTGRSSNTGARLGSDAHVQGEITELKTEQRSGSSGDQLVAEVESSKGRSVCVCLGPKDELKKLSLQKGDKITAEGVVSRKNGKQVLLASRITANGESVTQKLAERSAISRFEGTLKSMKEATSKRSNSTYLVGELDTDNGTKRVHFGPKRQLSKLQLSKGDDVKVLTRKGTAGGKTATIALQVSANGQTVKVVRELRNDNERSSEKRDRSDR